MAAPILFTDDIPEDIYKDIPGDNYPTEWNTSVYHAVMRGSGVIPRSRADMESSGAQRGQDYFREKAPREGVVRDVALNIRSAWSTINGLFDNYYGISFHNPFSRPTLDDKKILYQWDIAGPDEKNPEYTYPPHLKVIPAEDQVAQYSLNPFDWWINHRAIFNTYRLFDTGSILQGLIPSKIRVSSPLTPEVFVGATTIRDIETATHDARFEKMSILREVYSDPNIGDRADWYTDRVWAQQMFTGTNPMIITAASEKWKEEFQQEAKSQGGLEAVLAIMNDTDSRLYVADYSYFRKAASSAKLSIPEDATLCSSPSAGTEDPIRYSCASVGLFNLTRTGQLHPLAICLDYKGSLGEPSVTIFNKYPEPGQATLAQEGGDWPWRYAKTCLSAADWVHHELRVHLVNTHLVEEVLIVATERNFSDDDTIYKLLNPHWDKTLSLNAAARSILVPNVIATVSGFEVEWVYNYINNVYADFDFVGNYVENDLKRRGFPLEALKDKSNPEYKRYHNYTYGKNMAALWPLLRNFVDSYLKTDKSFDNPSNIRGNPSIKSWVKELKEKLPKFPDIKSRADLVDALTMCIHIASPQHTAVNYLQAYYQCFVINKPPALYKPLPSSLPALKQYTETDLFDSLPCNYPRDWLLASHLPWLLSYRVADNQTLANYAKTLARKGPAQLKPVAAKFSKDLTTIATKFKENSQEMDDQKKAYFVMDPNSTAVSILI